jgi:hypothetical protein
VSCFLLAVVEVWGQRGNELGLIHQNPLSFTLKIKLLLNLYKT